VGVANRSEDKFVVLIRIFTSRPPNIKPSRPVRKRGKQAAVVPAPSTPSPFSLFSRPLVAHSHFTGIPIKSFEEELLDSSTVFLSEEAELYRWDLDSGKFVAADSDVAEETGIYAAHILKRSSSEFEYWLMMSSHDGPLLARKISSAMNQRWNRNVKSFTWNHLSVDGKQSSWCLRFLDEEPYARFLTAYTQALWESLYQLSWEKMKVSNSSLPFSLDTELQLFFVTE